MGKKLKLITFNSNGGFMKLVAIFIKSKYCGKFGGLRLGKC